jgi:hypothetical protein
VMMRALTVSSTGRCEYHNRSRATPPGSAQRSRWEPHGVTPGRDRNECSDNGEYAPARRRYGFETRHSCYEV